MEKLEYELLEEIQAEVVEEPEEINVNSIKDYDPNKDFMRYGGKTFTFKRIPDLMLMQELRLIVDKNRPYIRGKKPRMMAGIEEKLYKEAYDLTVSPVTPYNKGKITEFINEHGKEPKSDLCLVIAFETPPGKLPGSYRLGLVTPPLMSIE